MTRVVTFGEIMTRFRIPGNKRIVQAFPGTLEATFAGAEANVAAGIALLGGKAVFVTSLPRHPIADACVTFFNGIGVDTSEIVHSDQGWLGVYYIEAGSSQRASTVLYDRDGSCIVLQGTDAYDWQRIFSDAKWLHTTGITPALSETAAESCITALRCAREIGLTISFDLNFRSKL